MSNFVRTICRSAAETERLAARLAAVCAPGDVVALSGALGAGKTTFARGFVRALTKDADEVPSPTFTLIQTYDTPRGAVWHCDLYRLTKPEDAWELGLEDAFADAICLIEWPERLGAALPPRRLAVTLSPESAAPDSRLITFDGDETWATRLKSMGPN
jgi:tRNA threonylcarbamoyladenosine biosynthesis protein TsaE